MKFNKRILKESNTTSLPGPEIGPGAGLTSLLIDSINKEWDTINEYNSIAITAEDAGYETIAKVLEEINTEENKHVGQLQELLKLLSPNAEAIDQGKEEAEDQIDDDASWFENN